MMSMKMVENNAREHLNQKKEHRQMTSMEVAENNGREHLNKKKEHRQMTSMEMAEYTTRENASSADPSGNAQLIRGRRAECNGGEETRSSTAASPPATLGDSTSSVDMSGVA